MVFECCWLVLTDIDCYCWLTIDAYCCWSALIVVVCMLVAGWLLCLVGYCALAGGGGG